MFNFELERVAMTLALADADGPASVVAIQQRLAKLDEMEAAGKPTAITRDWQAEQADFETLMAGNPKRKTIIDWADQRYIFVANVSTTRAIAEIRRTLAARAEAQSSKIEDRTERGKW